MIPFDWKEAMASGFFISGAPQHGKSTLAKKLVSMLIPQGITVYVLDTSQSWLRSDSPLKQSTAVLPGWKTVQFSGNTVFDLSRLGLHDRVRFVNLFCKALVSEHVNGKVYPELVLFEECQTYMPQGSFRLSIKKNPIFDGVVDLVTVGGNYNLRFGAVTQFPALCDKTPIKSAQQRYFGATQEPNDYAYLKQFLHVEQRKTLLELGKAEFVYQYRGHCERFKVQPFSVPEPSNPKLTQNSYANLNFEYCYNQLGMVV